MTGSLEEEDGLEPIGKFAAQGFERLAIKLFLPANDKPLPAFEDAA